MLVFGLSIESGIASSTANRGLQFTLVSILACVLLSSAGGPAAAQQRVLGLDVSAWQDYISQTGWNNIHNVDNRDFVFIRSSRGGTTGEDHRQGGYPSWNNDLFYASQRYDDPEFVWNITKATNAGMLAGAYHFSRPDIIEGTLNSDGSTNGIANTGADEADHFIEMAGAWMRPGYLLPVHDLEAGDGIRSDNQMAQFTIDFSDRIHEVMGIRPAIYTNGNYAYYVLGGASASLRTQVVEKHPTLWSARWPDGYNPFSGDLQTDHPKDSWTNIYGPWDDPPNPTHPWSFWQYTSVGYISSYSNRLDLNVAQGGIEFLKDRLVPALWTTDADGQWTTLTNWNSGQTPVAPVVSSGQLALFGSLTLPAVRLPGSDDTVILDRSAADITVTLASGAHNIRKLEVRETLNITGGSLTVNYVPSADSTPLAAQFSAPVALDGGSLSVHTLQVDATQTFSLGGGTLTLDTILLMPHSSTPATIDVIGDVTFNPLDNAAAMIVAGAGTGSSGLIDLEGANRAWQVGDGAAAVDLSVDVPIVNGALTKSGAGTLALGGANSYAGDTTVLEGMLSLDNPLLSDTADLYLTTGAMLELDFPSSVDVVDSLYIDGVSQTSGLWGADGSTASFTSPLITGDGFLWVSTYVAPIPGDFDHNGTVDGTDLAQWQGDFGLNGGSDADDDGDSDGADFLAWQRNFGSSAGAVASSQAIPEPSSIVLLMGVAAGCIISRSKWRIVENRFA